MKAFADLFRALDETNKTGEKLRALAHFFRSADPRDRVWTLALFSGRRPRRVITARQLATWTAEVSGLPDWMMDACYGMAGDLAETVGLLLPPADLPPSGRPLHAWMEEMERWRALDRESLRKIWREACRSLGPDERLPFHKLLTGGMRLGVSQNLLLRGIAEAVGQEPSVLARHLSGPWHPADQDWEELISGRWSESARQMHPPYPFFLAHALEGPLPDESSGDGASWPGVLSGGFAAWQAEWKWDGIRVQLLHHAGRVELWSRGEERITDAFPELALLAGRLPEGTALDGELLAHSGHQPLDFQALQTRLGRKAASRRLLRQVPVLLMAYDLLEERGCDVRHLPLQDRRARLDSLLRDFPMPGLLRLSPELPFRQWADLQQLRAQSRELGSEGLMLKRRDSAYGVGRRRGDWFKWKVDPYTVDAVLVYAQRGHGRRAGLFTDLTFALWKGEQLLPFTKAYSGLDQRELRELNAWIRLHTLAKNGPVVVLEPLQVFELGFEGVARSARHKAGIALRFPRILRWRRDKPAVEADKLEQLEALLKELRPEQPQPRTGDLFKDR
jgi:DNA ligase-1